MPIKTCIKLKKIHKNFPTIKSFPQFPFKKFYNYNRRSLEKSRKADMKNEMLGMRQRRNKTIYN